MKFYETFKQADAMGIDREVAANIRIAYLTEIREEIEEIYDEGYNEVTKGYIQLKIDKIQDEIDYLNKFKAKEASNKITQDMIDNAKAYPIGLIIEFNSAGKAEAFCHKDKNPSLSKHPSENYCRCFTCGKSFDPIAVLMERDGMAFHDAVRSLQ